LGQPLGGELATISGSFGKRVPGKRLSEAVNIAPVEPLNRYQGQAQITDTADQPVQGGLINGPNLTGFQKPVRFVSPTTLLNKN